MTHSEEKKENIAVNRFSALSMVDDKSSKGHYNEKGDISNLMWNSYSIFTRSAALMLKTVAGI